MTLEQTKGKFQMRGIVTGLGNQNAVRNGETKDDKPWKSIRFGVKTSPTSTVYVELFGLVRDEIFAYNPKKKETIKLPWSKRKDTPKGYHLIGVNLTLDGQRKTFVEMDAIDYLLSHLSDGDSVFVSGEPSFSEYTNQQEVTTTQTRFNFRTVSLQKQEIDFEAEDFEPTCNFEQDIVVTDIMEDEDDDDKLYVNAYIINYGEKFVPTQFVVDGKRNKKMKSAFQNLVSWGDKMKIYGDIVNEVIIVQEETVELEDDPFGSEENKIGGGIRDYVNHLLITGVDVASWEKKKYTEDDFVIAEAEQNYGDEDPFDSDDNDIGDDDELPFS